MDPETQEAPAAPAQETPGKPAATPAGKPSRPSFDERHARAGRIIAARKAERSTDEAEKPAPDPEEPAEDATSDDSEKPAATDQTPEKRFAAALAAFDKGDMRALAKALGKDAKAADAHDTKFTALKRRSERVTKREHAADKREATLDKRDIEGRNLYGDPAAAKKAYEAGDYHAAGTYMQRLFGDDFATVTKKMARAIADMPPERLSELRRLEEAERKAKRLETEAEQRKHNEKKSAGRTQALATVATKCKGHDALLIEDGADLILRELETSFDGTIDLKKAADAVLEREIKRLNALLPVLEKRKPKGKSDKPAATPEEKPTPGRKPRVEQPAASTAGGGRKLFNGKVALSFEQRQAMAERRTARQKGLA
jgi:hypothetical protein